MFKDIDTKFGVWRFRPQIYIILQEQSRFRGIVRGIRASTDEIQQAVRFTETAVVVIREGNIKQRDWKMGGILNFPIDLVRFFGVDKFFQSNFIARVVCYFQQFFRVGDSLDLCSEFLVGS